MSDKKVSTLLNLSNQANYTKAFKSHLSQFNFIIIMGREYLEKGNDNSKDIPLSISISKSGEIEIVNIDEENNNDIDIDNICIYSDKKITDSDE
ncbi:hypothetical protein [Ruminiclostridium papyrosolvens]|uniref:Uncharacterized protein n=1 Tax=Ruminiclostridium papyrosolvens C7 TaxID=1330534 RepID=U4R1C6_9FIRM|nr:hypothetical protein [Ruminiclostridium papyrosolvens]EPR10475.1 hypothetical protein L323_12575 [Ruminiclostridium papyrosolvens C7]